MTSTTPTPLFDAIYSRVAEIERAEDRVGVTAEPQIANESSNQVYIK